MKIQDLIKLGENVSLDFKEKLPSPDDLAKLLVAFSNTKGGKIIIGVIDKTHEINGLELDLNVEEYVMNVASNNCLPLISPSLEFISYQKKLIAVIEVPVGEQKPYQVKRLGTERGVFVRIGSTNRLADAALRAELGRESRNITFDKLTVGKAGCDDFDLEKVKRYQELKERRLGTPPEKIDEDYLEKIGAYKKSNGKRVPTIGGLLLFGKQPQSITDLPRAIVKAARFRGKDKGYIIDQVVIEDTLPEQISHAVQFILKNIKISGKVKGLKRIDRPEYPIAAFREAITNAVVHRDYFLADSMAISIAIFDDRIEIESPGMLPQGVTVENIIEKQRTRNPLIARILFEMDYFDEWGQGIERMINAMKDAGLPDPVFKEEGLSFVVTLRHKRRGAGKVGDRVGEKVGDRVGEKVGENLTGNQQKIVKIIQSNNRVSAKEIARQIGISSRKIEENIKKLKLLGLLQRIGSAKGGLWRIIGGKK